MKKSFLVLTLLTFPFVSCFDKPSPANLISKDEAMRKTGLSNPEQALSFAQTQQGLNSVLAPYLDAVMKAEEQKCKDKTMDDWRKMKIYSQVLSSVQQSIDTPGMYPLSQEISPEEYVELLSGKIFLDNIKKKRFGNTLGFGSSSFIGGSEIVTDETTIPSADECFCERFDYIYNYNLTQESEEKNQNRDRQQTQTKIVLAAAVTKKERNKMFKN